ncbi:hypothetical protein [Rhizobium terrae]|uniref:hypothetical protein n=1 Tax=Rhizobium terrae TaxID=2171756 RepID=UPI000E3C93CA|nr:hypothetical protein [Rhizobium terrae]
MEFKAEVDFRPLPALGKGMIKPGNSGLLKFSDWSEACCDLSGSLAALEVLAFTHPAAAKPR